MIATITLNPAVDRRYNIDSLDKNTVKRTEDYHASAGGKGLNVSRVLKALGQDVATFGFLGGNTGDFIRKKVSQLGVEDKFTSIDGTTRTCLNIIDDDGNNIEVLEKGPTISKKDMNKFLKEFKDELDNLDIIAISGSLPQGLNKDIYAEIIEIANSREKKVILDASGDALTQSLKSGPYLIKPNREELENITGMELNDEESIKKAAKIVLDKGAKNIAISLGNEGMYFFGEEGNFKVDIPEIEVENPVGSGDSSVAGFAYGLYKNLSIEDTLKYANACGMSNAMRKTTGSVDPDTVKDLLEKIIVKEV